MENRETILRSKEFLFSVKGEFLEFCKNEIVKLKGSLLDNEDPNESAKIIYEFFASENESDLMPFKKNFLSLKRKGVDLGILFLNLALFLQKEYLNHIKNAGYEFEEEAIKFIVFLENKVKIIESFFINSKGNYKEALIKERKKAESILDIFKNIQENRQSVKLLNFYRGVPIESEAFVLECDDELVVLRTSHLQEIVMKINGKVFVQKGDFFPQTVKADVELVNFMNNSVTIKNPRYYFSSRLQKSVKELKIEPKFPLSVKAGKNLAIFNGWILNISLKELTLMSEEDICEKEEEIFIKLSFEESGEVTEIVARVEDKYFKNGYYYYFLVISSPQNDERIGSFIKRRTKEAIFELEEELKHYIA